MERPYTEILLSDEADPASLEHYVNCLVSLLGAKIISHIHDPDTDYVDIEIDNEKITLHRQTFIGISIFPTALGSASQQANALIEKAARLLKA